MDSDEKPDAVVLLSGGLDSATVLALAVARGYRCHALSFDYGQRHRFELDSARLVAAAGGAVDHRVVKIDLSASGGFGCSALTDDIDVPKDGLAATGETTGETTGEVAGEKIPVTYVPARNTIFLSFALGYAEVVGSFDIFCGVNAVDYSGYPDCRPAFISAFENLANLATAATAGGGRRFVIHAPLIEMTKGEIIRTGLDMGVDYGLTHSCYDPASDGKSCSRCDACRLRLAGFAQAGAKDPLAYM